MRSERTVGKEVAVPKSTKLKLEISAPSRSGAILAPHSETGQKKGDESKVEKKGQE